MQGGGNLIYHKMFSTGTIDLQETSNIFLGSVLYICYTGNNVLRETAQLLNTKSYFTGYKI